MKSKILAAGILLAGLLSAGVARAESLSLATTSEGTAIHFYGIAISKTAKARSGLDIRPKPYRSAGQGAVFVDRGEVAFGLYNAVVLREAYEGREFYAGKPLRNIRLIARLVPFQLTFGTRPDSGIDTVADIRGKRFPSGFDATAFGDRLYLAMLATGGLGPGDVAMVPVADWAGLGKAFVRNQIDVNGLVVGSPIAKRFADMIDGYRAVSLDGSEAAQAGLRAVFPDARLVTVEPAPGLDGVDRPVTVLEYDYWLYANAATPDAAVAALLSSLFEGADDLAAISADFRDFDARAMYQDIGVPFHPAALAFFDAHDLR